MHANGNTAIKATDAIRAAGGVKCAALGVSVRPHEEDHRGERRLFMALLEDAIRNYQKYAFSVKRRGQRLFREVETWLTEGDTGAAVSFEYVCDVLGVEPDYVRNFLERWRVRAREAATAPTRMRVAPVAAFTRVQPRVREVPATWTNPTVGSFDTGERPVAVGGASY
jgi:hypothetical protein